MKRGVVTSLLSAALAAVLAAVPPMLVSGGPVAQAQVRVSGVAVQAAPAAASPAVQGAQASVRTVMGGGFGTAGWFTGYEYPGNETVRRFSGSGANSVIVFTEGEG